jgi:hypothetical protein
VTPTDRPAEPRGHDPLDAAHLLTWRAEITETLDGMQASFEATYGYPPDTNEVTVPDQDGLEAARQLAARPHVPAPLATFYRTIAQAQLPDVGNGYFILTAAFVVDDLDQLGPINLHAAGPGVFFAADGGGIYFTIAADGTVHRSATASRTSTFEQVAFNLGDFLDQLRRAVIRFVTTGQPGDL